MRQLLAPSLLWFSAIGCGLLAGLYIAFSTFVMTALGRIGQPTEIASVAVFLASGAGGWMTGQILQASGGMHL